MKRSETVGDPSLAGVLVALYVAIQRIYSQTSRELGLTPQQAQLLCEADRRTPTLSALASEMGCDKANITGLVERMSRRGIIERLRDDHDGRVVRVQPTYDGRQLVRQLEERLESRLGGIDVPAGAEGVLAALQAGLVGGSVGG